MQQQQQHHRRESSLSTSSRDIFTEVPTAITLDAIDRVSSLERSFFSSFACCDHHLGGFHALIEHVENAHPSSDVESLANVQRFPLLALPAGENLLPSISKSCSSAHTTDLSPPIFDDDMSLKSTFSTTPSSSGCSSPLLLPAYPVYSGGSPSFPPDLNIVTQDFLPEREYDCDVFYRTASGFASPFPTETVSPPDSPSPSSLSYSSSSGSESSSPTSYSRGFEYPYPSYDSDPARSNTFLQEALSRYSVAPDDILSPTSSLESGRTTGRVVTPKRSRAGLAGSIKNRGPMKGAGGYSKGKGKSPRTAADIPRLALPQGSATVSPSRHGLKRGDRLYPCPHAGCVKSYKNPNGLKYHIDVGTCVFETAAEETTQQANGPVNPMPAQQVVSMPNICAPTPSFPQAAPMSMLLPENYYPMSSMGLVGGQ